MAIIKWSPFRRLLRINAANPSDVWLAAYNTLLSAYIERLPPDLSTVLSSFGAATKMQASTGVIYDDKMYVIYEAFTSPPPATYQIRKITNNVTESLFYTYTRVYADGLIRIAANSSGLIIMEHSYNQPVRLSFINWDGTLNHTSTISQAFAPWSVESIDVTNNKLILGGWESTFNQNRVQVYTLSTLESLWFRDTVQYGGEFPTSNLSDNYAFQEEFDQGLNKLVTKVLNPASGAILATIPIYDHGAAYIPISHINWAVSEDNLYICVHGTLFGAGDNEGWVDHYKIVNGVFVFHNKRNVYSNIKIPSGVYVDRKKSNL